LNAIGKARDLSEEKKEIMAANKETRVVDYIHV